MAEDTEDTEEEYSDEDREALQRAEELGITQFEKLGLKPWQYPPDFINVDEIPEILVAGPNPHDDQKTFEAATLAKQLLDAGLSLYEPDPERALHDSEYRKKIKARVLKLRAGKA